MTVRIGIVLFPGSNRDIDAVNGLTVAGADPRILWHEDVDLSDVSGILLPGGFSVQPSEFAKPAFDATCKMALCQFKVVVHPARILQCLNKLPGFSDVLEKLLDRKHSLRPVAMCGQSHR